MSVKVTINIDVADLSESDIAAALQSVARGIERNGYIHTVKIFSQSISGYKLQRDIFDRRDRVIGNCTIEHSEST